MLTLSPLPLPSFINHRRWRDGAHIIAVVVVVAVIAVVVAVAVAVKGAHIDCNDDGNEHGNEFKNFEFVGELIAPTSFFELNNFSKFEILYFLKV